jgi:hypothetical protein
MMLNHKVFFGTIFIVQSLAVISNTLLSERSPDMALISHQLVKITSPADILILGDSSIGNSLNAEVATRLLNLKVINLALTGSYGVTGSVELLKAYLNQNIPRCVFVVQSVDVFQRVTNEKLIVESIKKKYYKGGGFSKSDLDIGSALRNVHSLFPVKPDTEFFVADYIQQGPKKNYANIPATTPLARPSNSNLKALSELNGLCAEYKLNCNLAFGPVVDKRHHWAQAYTRSAIPKYPMIRVLFDSTPFQIDQKALGDAEDHVAPKFKDQYTKQWVSLINTSCKAEMNAPP